MVARRSLKKRSAARVAWEPFTPKIWMFDILRLCQQSEIIKAMRVLCVVLLAGVGVFLHAQNAPPMSSPLKSPADQKLNDVLIAGDRNKLLGKNEEALQAYRMALEMVESEPDLSRR